MASVRGNSALALSSQKRATGMDLGAIISRFGLPRRGQVRKMTVQLWVRMTAEGIEKKPVDETEARSI